MLRWCPEFDKAAVGEYLGGPGEWEKAVLRSFAQGFNFRGMTIDDALRTFLQVSNSPHFESHTFSRFSYDTYPPLSPSMSL